MLHKYWLYFLVDEQGRCYVVNNGIVSATAQRTPLVYTPDGWQEISIAYERDFVRVGLLRNFTLPLGFVMDGAKILRKTFYTENLEKRIFLLIQKLTLDLTDTTYNWRYKYFYRGELDFSTLKDEANKVTVSIAEGGIQKLFNANADTTYEIPFDKDAIIVKIDGLFLYETYNYIVPAITTAPRVPHHFIGAGFTTQDGQAAGFAVFSVFYQDIPTNPNDSTQINVDWANDLRYLFTATQDIEGVNLKGELKLRSTVPGDVSYAVFLYDSDGNGITLGSTPLTSNSFTTLSIDETFNVQAGKKYFLIGSLGGYAEAVEFEETRFSISLHSRYKPTYCKAFKAMDLFKKLAAKMGIDPKYCASTLLPSVQDIVITCGNAIRSLPGSAIKTSMNQFLEFCRTEHAAGFGIEGGMMVVERFAHFLNYGQTKALGNVKDLAVSYATDLMANTVKVGYPDQDIDNVNGKYEFNNTHVYTSPITRVTKELNLVCPYLAQPYLIETIRLNLEGKTTTDNGSDNDTFLLHADLASPLSFHASSMTTDGSGHRMYFTEASDFYDAVTERDMFTLSGTQFNNDTFTISGIAVLPDGRIVVNVYEDVAPETVNTQITFSIPVYPLERLNYLSISGIPEGSEAFNIDYLTPKEMLLRHTTWINAIMDGFAGQFLTFQTTEKNANLRTAFGGVIIEQKADVMIGVNKLFIPKYFDFENEVPVDLVETLEANPNTAFTFVWNNTTFIGFSKRVGIAPNTMKEQAFKLLCAPFTNFSTLL